MNAIAVVTLENGLVIPDDISEIDHRELGDSLAVSEQAAQTQLKRCQWALGDWYNKIKWGDKQKYCESFGKTEEGKWRINYGTASKCGIVAAAFNISNQTPGSNLADKPHRTILNFKCHRVAADGTTGTQRTQLIEAAIAAKHIEGKYWSSAKINHERKKMLGIVEKPKLSKDGSNAMIADAMASLPKATSKAARRVVEDLIQKLGKQFHSELEQAVTDGIEKDKAALGDERKRLESARKGHEQGLQSIDGFMTKKEFQTILQCLSPDRPWIPEDKKRMYTEAFNIFQVLKDTVRDDLRPEVKRARGW